MARSRPVVVLEFNELSPALMERFLGEGALPRFRRLRDASQAFVTEAEERYPYLEPWVQWLTVHSGMNYREHGVHHLGEGHRVRAKRVWDVLSDHGYASWICGSMNAGLASPLRGAILPDPWSPAVEPRPRELAAYFDFVSAMVHGHASGGGLAARRALRFAAFMAGHGLGAPTVAGVAAQLVEERLAARRGLDAGWKRACVLDQLQLDLFRSLWLRDRPDFATFFSNSTAHFQHWHWRNLEPERFQVKPTAREQASYAGAVRHGYERMDRLVGEVLDFCGDDAVVVLCTALSQQPCLVYEDEGGRVNYRPRELRAFLARAGVAGVLAAEPVMDEQFRIRFAGEPEAERGLARLSALSTGGRGLMVVRRQGTELLAGCAVHEPVPAGARVAGEGLDVPFEELLFRLPGMKSGMHHPDGLLWIRVPGCAPRVHPEKVALDRVAPTLLGLFGLPPAATMRGAPLELPRPGRRRVAA
ncbi:hypothetical protein [Anaeromyxobacter paludicola]|uniref:Type I phosphodiesterase/nucleotide pyrophosphatase n=1 Tax=Anaeromyxobacter paludicola TaxID=2918171 RepID=A0ABM7X691_9BACT|nr:hypothetical protein [Anaeromyxobacter paludicola]BDG07334.1 hypothetical protein AMPC_04470 [Anaeromyxobacter paludicola]